MRDIGGSCEDGGGQLDGCFGLALEVIDRLARRRNGVGPLQTELVNRIMALAVSPEQGAVERMADAFRASRVPPDRIVDLYIPEVARAMGCAWEEDRLGFAQVTIGSSRLQDLLHRMNCEVNADSVDPGGTGAVLVVVPMGEQHTLGALVLAKALRRRGISVSIQIGPSLADLSRLLSVRQFDGAMISVSTTDRLEISAKLVKTLKHLTKGRLRVAVGGVACGEARSVMADTGADLVTNDLDVAISGFGLLERNASSNRR